MQDYDIYNYTILIFKTYVHFSFLFTLSNTRFHTGTHFHSMITVRLTCLPGKSENYFQTIKCSLANEVLDLFFLAVRCPATMFAISRTAKMPGLFKQIVLFLHDCNNKVLAVLQKNQFSCSQLHVSHLWLRPK